MSTRAESQFGMPNSSDILTSGRLIINGYHEKDAYEIAEDSAAQGIVPFYPGSLEPRHRRILDGDICLTRKSVLSSIGEVSRDAGYRVDGYVGAETATGFSLLNGQGRGPQPGINGSEGESGDSWYQMVSRYTMAGIADQSATFRQHGFDDDVDITFQRRGLKTMRNNGPHTLHKGNKWMWEIPRSARHAKMILSTVPRQDDRPEDRITPYPREFDPINDQINTKLMHKILVEKRYSNRESELFDTEEPIVSAIQSFDTHMRQCFALKDFADRLIAERENPTELIDPKNEVANASAEFESHKDLLDHYLVTYGLKKPETKEDIRKQKVGVNQWKLFKYLLYARHQGEEAMIAKLPATSTTMPELDREIRMLQETAIDELLGSIADGNLFTSSRIGGVILSDAEPGSSFDTILESN